MTHLISPSITPFQRNIIIGTILGGSSIVKPKRGKNCYLSMRGKNIQWLLWKASHLSELASREPLTVEQTNRWHSVCYPVFNEFHQMFYKNDKRYIHIDSLSLLQDKALVVWYGDCGKTINDKVVFNTHIWGKSGTEKIVEYFQYLDYKPSIVIERNNYRVHLDEESSADFLQMVLPHLPINLTVT